MRSDRDAPRFRLVLVFALVVFVVGCSPSGEGVSVDATVAGQTSTTTLGAAELEVVQVAVGETLDRVVEDPASVVASGGVLDGVDLDAGLPEGATVVMDESTLVVSNDIAEVVAVVTLPSGEVDRFGVVLVPDGDQWLIAYTVLLP